MKYFKNLKVRYKVTAIGLAVVIALGITAAITINVSKVHANDVMDCFGRRMVTELKYLTVTAHLGSPVARAKLGYMYYMGKGVRKNIESAYVWLTLASFKGDMKSAQISALVILKLTPEQIKSADLRIYKISNLRMRREWF